MPIRLLRVCSALTIALAMASVNAAAKVNSPIDRDVVAGKNIAFSGSLGNCVACHALPGAKMAGNVGPRLGPRIKRVFHTKRKLVQFLEDPQARLPHIVMPAFGKNHLLSVRQLHQVADYLWSLPASHTVWWKTDVPRAAPARTRTEIVDYFHRKFPKLSLQDYALGSSALNPQLRAQDQQLGAFSPAGFVLAKGKKLWHEPFPDGKTYASCYAYGGRGVAVHYPQYSEARHEVVTLAMSINACRKEHGLKALRYGKGDMVAVETYLDSLSNGMPIDVQAGTPGAAKAFQVGQRFFFQREGRLGLACASCHVGAAGHYLRAQLLSPALGWAATFPKYRMKWGAVGTLQRRFRGCQKKIRATPEPFESANYRNLQYFLTYLSNGIKINVPGNGP